MIRVQAFALSLSVASLIAAGVSIAQSQTSAGTQSQTSTTESARTSTVLDTAQTDTESPLVRAAREAKAMRKTHPKVITNKDVKNSKGKLMIYSPAPLPPGTTTAVPATDTRSPLDKADADYRTWKAAGERVAADEKKVTELEKDLAAIEQSYYEEKDLNRRDTVIQKRFSQVKRQLDDARHELADARDTAAAAKP